MGRSVANFVCVMMVVVVMWSVFRGATRFRGNMAREQEMAQKMWNRLQSDTCRIPTERSASDAHAFCDKAETAKHKTPWVEAFKKTVEEEVKTLFGLATAGLFADRGPIFMVGLATTLVFVLWAVLWCSGCFRRDQTILGVLPAAAATTSPAPTSLLGLPGQSGQLGRLGGGAKATAALAIRTDRWEAGSDAGSGGGGGEGSDWGEGGGVGGGVESGCGMGATMGLRRVRKRGVGW